MNADEAGATSAEYALLASVIGAAIVLAVWGLASKVVQLFTIPWP